MSAGGSWGPPFRPWSCDLYNRSYEKRWGRSIVQWPRGVGVDSLLPRSISSSTTLFKPSDGHSPLPKHLLFLPFFHNLVSMLLCMSFTSSSSLGRLPCTGSLPVLPQRKPWLKHILRREISSVRSLWMLLGCVTCVCHRFYRWPINRLIVTRTLFCM